MNYLPPLQPPLAYKTKFRFRGTTTIEEVSPCYGICRKIVAPQSEYWDHNKKVYIQQKNPNTFTHIDSVFRYHKQTLTHPEVDWFWNEVLLPAIPKRVSPFMTIVDGNILQTPINDRKEIPYKTITLDINKVSWDDILILFTIARTMQEFPSAIRLAFKLQKKYPKCTPDQAFFFGLTFSPPFQAGHTLISIYDHPTYGEYWQELKTYSFKNVWKNYGPMSSIFVRGETRLNKTFALKSKGTWTQNERNFGSIDGYMRYRGTYLKNFIRMVR